MSEAYTSRQHTVKQLAEYLLASFPHDAVVYAGDDRCECVRGYSHSLIVEQTESTAVYILGSDDSGERVASDG